MSCGSLEGGGGDKVVVVSLSPGRSSKAFSMALITISSASLLVARGGAPTCIDFDGDSPRLGEEDIDTLEAAGECDRDAIDAAASAAAAAAPPPPFLGGDNASVMMTIS